MNNENNKNDEKIKKFKSLINFKIFIINIYILIIKLKE